MKKNNFKTGNPVLDKAIKHALKIARKHETVGVETCDLESEAVEMTLRLMKDYNPEKHCSVETYIHKPVEGCVIDFLRMQGHVVRMSSCESLTINSLDGGPEKDDGENLGLEEIIADTYAEERKKLMEDLDTLEYAMSMLTPHERKIIRICFRFEKAKETVSHYIKRKGISEFVFRYQVKAVIDKLSTLCQR